MFETIGKRIRQVAAVMIVTGIAMTYALPIHAQLQEPAAQSAGAVTVSAQTMERLEQHLAALEAEVTELKTQVRELRTASSAESRSSTGIAHDTVDGVAEAAAPSNSYQALQANGSLTKEDRSILNYLKGTTINGVVDTYYEYNFNDPVGRVNLLRAYDVSSNAFSLNQAGLIIERAPDLDAGRRYGARLDLQFGQATATLQGNPLNEPRPDIYRNIFQAYGTYVVPVGSGLTVDFGKWASSLGYEGNYTQFQMNYSRSYWFDFLPFYHMGVNANYKLNNKIAFNYWMVNGTNQTEPTNGFKDELFGLVVTPNKNISWTVNYYLGQEHPNAIAVATCGPVPVQPGLCFQQVSPAPNGKTHIFDSYVSWQSTPKLTLVLEGDYEIERLWANTAPGQSSAPSNVWGGAAYAKYQFTPRTYLAGRTEYLSDTGGLFTGITSYAEALKEVTATYDFQVADGFDMRWEYRRDFSNRPIFLTGTQGVYSTDQNTATLGVIWWFGRKQGPW
jgi:Putative beta-barrel porin-2, OmpL-like. bbp2